MSFDIKSMKQRANALMASTKPNPKLIGILFACLLFAYFMVFFYALEIEKYIIILIPELVYFNFRNCCNWYAMKVSREETTSYGDGFSAFKQKPAKIILMSLIREILYLVGALVAIVGIVFPVYWFRFAGHIIKDEEIGIFGALVKSKKMLKGHYVELIKLDVSNLGWFALLYSTFGLAGFYVKPYLSIVYAEFYDYIKAQMKTI